MSKRYFAIETTIAPLIASPKNVAMKYPFPYTRPIFLARDSHFLHLGYQRYISISLLYKRSICSQINKKPPNIKLHTINHVIIHFLHGITYTIFNYYVYCTFLTYIPLYILTSYFYKSYKNSHAAIYLNINSSLNNMFLSLLVRIVIQM